MTGAYLRVKRDGKWQSIEIEYLTNEERILAFKNKDAKECYRWIVMLCKEITKAEKTIAEFKSTHYWK